MSLALSSQLKLLTLGENLAKGEIFCFWGSAKPCYRFVRLLSDPVARSRCHSYDHYERHGGSPDVSAKCPRNTKHGIITQSSENASGRCKARSQFHVFNRMCKGAKGLTDFFWAEALPLRLNRPRNKGRDNRVFRPAWSAFITVSNRLQCRVGSNAPQEQLHIAIVPALLSKS